VHLFTPSDSNDGVISVLPWVNFRMIVGLDQRIGRISDKNSTIIVI